MTASLYQLLALRGAVLGSSHVFTHLIPPHPMQQELFHCAVGKITPGELKPHIGERVTYP